jgi:hypothetical protein
MVDFSIRSLIITPVNRHFEHATNFITHRYHEIDASKINHDLKVLMFNSSTALIVSTVSMGYLKMIALVTAVVLAVLFYLVRRLIAETIASPQKTLADEVLETARSKLPANRLKLAAPEKPWRERIREYLCQNDNVVIGTIVIMKLTHYPTRQLIEMLLTRSP